MTDPNKYFDPVAASMARHLRPPPGFPVMCSTVPFPPEVAELLRERLVAQAREAERCLFSDISSVRLVEEITLDDVRETMLRLMPPEYRERFERDAGFS